MKKVILTAAFMMFVSGNVFLANAQDPVKKEKPVTEQAKTRQQINLRKKILLRRSRSQRNQRRINLVTPLQKILLLWINLRSLLNKSKHTNNKSRSHLVYSRERLLLCYFNKIIHIIWNPCQRFPSGTGAATSICSLDTG